MVGSGARACAGGLERPHDNPKAYQTIQVHPAPNICLSSRVQYAREKVQYLQKTYLHFRAQELCSHLAFSARQVQDSVLETLRKTQPSQHRLHHPPALLTISPRGQVGLQHRAKLAGVDSSYKAPARVYVIAFGCCHLLGGPKITPEQSDMRYDR